MFIVQIPSVTTITLESIIVVLFNFYVFMQDMTIDVHKCPQQVASTIWDINDLSLQGHNQCFDLDLQQIVKYKLWLKGGPLVKAMINILNFKAIANCGGPRPMTENTKKYSLESTICLDPPNINSTCHVVANVTHIAWQSELLHSSPKN